MDGRTNGDSWIPLPRHIMTKWWNGDSAIRLAAPIMRKWWVGDSAMRLPAHINIVIKWWKGESAIRLPMHIMRTTQGARGSEKEGDMIARPPPPHPLPVVWLDFYKFWVKIQPNLNVQKYKIGPFRTTWVLTDKSTVFQSLNYAFLAVRWVLPFW